MQQDLKNYKIILTGAPCSGKSSLIEALEKKGYQIIPEVFQLLYAQAFENKSADTFFVDQLALRYRLMHAQIDLESRLDSGRITFLDRSVWDIIFFGEWYNIQMPPDLYSLAAHQRYDYVFFLDLLPRQFYQTTQFRGESFELAQKMHHFFLEKYRKTGLSILQVPFDTIENRADYILRFLKLHKK